MSKIQLSGTRRSVIAGSWYPGTAAGLTSTIEEYLAQVDQSAIEGELYGLISPHAGYVYSGQVAAYAYKQLEGKKYDTVAVISPSHRMYIPGYGFTAARYYETPLGKVELDVVSLTALDDAVSLTALQGDSEHSLEIQLPFLQHMLGEFKLLPVMMGEQSLSSCQKLANGLVQVLQGKNALLVASTDLSHFHSYSAAQQLDNYVLEHIAAYDPAGLMSDLKMGKCEACGGAPVTTVMLAAQQLGANKAKILKYANSGDVTGDHSQVVGYAAGAIYSV